MEQQPTLDELIQQTHDWLVAAKYSKGTVYSFKCITNQLKIPFLLSTFRTHHSMGIPCNMNLLNIHNHLIDHQIQWVHKQINTTSISLYNDLVILVLMAVLLSSTLGITPFLLMRYFKAPPTNIKIFSKISKAM